MEKLLEERGKIVDEFIEKIIQRNKNSVLYDAVWYHLKSGGKRIRPALCLLTCKLLGGEEKKALPFAAACELLHSWALIHDDIEDGDTVRRNKPAVWVKYGLAQGINIGDFLNGKVYECIFKSKEYGIDNETILKLIKVLTQVVISTTEGQAMDINFRSRRDVSEEEYMEMAKKKTGNYLVLPIIGGTIIAGKEEYIETLRKFGEYIGPAFQIRDDLIDLTEGKGRGEIGCDIKEGKRSLLVIYTASRCNKEEKEKLYEILDKPREKTTKQDIEFVINLFKKYRAFEYAQNKAEGLIREGIKVIEKLPEEVKNFLESVAVFIVKRKS